MATGNETTEKSWQQLFLERLSVCGNVSESATAAGVCRATCYRESEADKDFRDAWQDAQEQANDLLEKEARRRAIEGCDEPIFYKGEDVGSIRKYSDTLMIFLLKAHRPEKFRETVQLNHAGHDGGRLEIVETIIVKEVDATNQHQTPSGSS